MGLFKLSAKTNINGVELNKLTYDDKDLFNDIFFSKDHNSIMFYVNFPVLYCRSLSEKKEYYWKIIEGYLCIFVKLSSERVFLYTNPMSKNHDEKVFKGVIEECVRLIHRMNELSTSKNPNVYIDNCVYSLVEPLFDFSKKEKFDYGWDEFIFKTDDFIAMKGKQYKGRRNIINKFSKEYNHTIREYTMADFDAIVRLRKLWIANKSIDEKKLWDKELFYELFRQYDKLDTKAFVMEVNGNIEGVITLARLASDCAVTINETTNVEFQGMTEKLWHEGVKATADFGEYTNDGNGGKHTDGLYAYKSSFNPVQMNKVVGASFMGKNNELDFTVFK